MKAIRQLLLIFLLFPGSAGALLGDLFTGTNNETPLDPKVAFQFSARQLDDNTLLAQWQIKPGYYLYRSKISFGSKEIALGEPQLPPGENHEDDFLGTQEIYRDQVNVRLPVLPGKQPVADLTAIVTARSQGCWDGGVCYPPLDQQSQFIWQAANDNALPAPTGLQGSQSTELFAGDEAGRLASLLADGYFLAQMLTFFGLGILLAFTPCVLPMVPILSSMIAHHGQTISHRRTLTLSLAFVLGMAVTYALIGIAAGLSGAMLSASLQNGWVLGAFALIMVLLSLAMFDLYRLEAPQWLQEKLATQTNRLRPGGSHTALTVMGALSALIVGPCVAAPLAGALLYIASTGNAVLGGLALFAMALGMGIPLLAVGVFSRTILPQSGAWMSAVKKFFGIILLGTALWILSPVLPGWLFMTGLSALLIIPAIYMHALDPLPASTSNLLRFWKGIGVIMMISGVAMWIGVLGGADDPLRPLSFLADKQSQNQKISARFTPVDSIPTLNQYLHTSQKPVMLDFYADWCISCKELERFTFAEPTIASRLSQFTLLRADVTVLTPEQEDLLQTFGLFGPPGIIFFNANGQPLMDLRVIGFIAPEPFTHFLDQALSQYTLTAKSQPQSPAT